MARSPHAYEWLESGALAELGGTRDLVFARFANLVTARADLA
jgi:hypothetical protein